MSQQVEWFSRAESSVSLINRSVGSRGRTLGYLERHYSYNLALRRQGNFLWIILCMGRVQIGTGMACIKKGGNKIVESDEMKKLTLPS